MSAHIAGREPQALLFEENQTFHRVFWVMAVVAGVASLQWWAFVQQIVLGRPFGDNPGPDWFIILFWLLFGIGLPLFFWGLRLRVTVDREELVIAFRPLTTRVIPVAEIETVAAETYNMLFKFGGWGIRGPGGRRAYTVSGSDGVELRLSNGDVVVIGTRQPRKLEWAIHAVMGASGVG